MVQAGGCVERKHPSVRAEDRRKRSYGRAAHVHDQREVVRLSVFVDVHRLVRDARTRGHAVEPFFVQQVANKGGQQRFDVNPRGRDRGGVSLVRIVIIVVHERSERIVSGGDSLTDPC